MTSKKTILIVEDDTVISFTLRELLEENGYEVLSAPNGSEGLKVLKASIRTHLILLDLMMPIMDGFEFRENQLQDPAVKDVPVVVMSADGHVVEKKMRTAARDYVKKPLDIYQLLEVVEKNVS